VHRSLIVAKMLPGAAPRVADLFRESDSTPLPEQVGVFRRSLYARDDLYIHVLETSRPSAEALRIAQREDEFHRVSAALAEFITPYDPRTWRSPADALAHEFYRYDAPAG
jgi:cyclase